MQCDRWEFRRRFVCMCAGVVPTVAKSTPSYQRLAATYVAALNSSFFSRYSQFETSSSSSAFRPSSFPSSFPANVNRVFSALSAPSSWVAFGYDTMYLLAYALHELIEVQHIDLFTSSVNSLNSSASGSSHLTESLLRLLTNLTFDGSSGTITLDLNGDRENALIEVINVWDGNLIPLGTIHRGNASLNYYSETTRVMFASGTSTPPIDLINPLHQLVNISDVTITLIIVIAAVLCVAFLILSYVYVGFRGDAGVKASSPLFTMLYVCGSIILTLSTVARAAQNQDMTTPTPCYVEIFTANCGYTLMILALSVKIFRIATIFRSNDSFQDMTQRHRFWYLADGYLLMWIGIGLVVEVVLLLMLTVVDPYEVAVVPYSSSAVPPVSQGAATTAPPTASPSPAPASSSSTSLDDVHYDLKVCNSSVVGVTELWLPFIFTTRFLLLGVMCVFAFRGRNVPTLFKYTVKPHIHMPTHTNTHVTYTRSHTHTYTHKHVHTQKHTHSGSSFADL